MKKEIIDWYSERHYQLHKMINAGAAKRLNQSQIEYAMIHCYTKIVNENKKISDVDIARYVFNVATDADCSQRDTELKELYQSKEKIKEWKQLIFAYFTGSILIHILMILFHLSWR